MDKSFIDLFEEQVLKTPGNIAVVFEQQQLSYNDLNEQANMLAHYLQSKGVKEETLVPLYIERGLEMMIGMLGIMKAGGAYVPIDTDFPGERISFMLKDTAAKIVVSSKKSSSKLVAEKGIEIVEIEKILDQPKNNLLAKVLPGNLAYVIYTSGSTGNPKGVMVEHRNLVDYVTGLINKTQINECRSFALVSTIATDLGNTVIYTSLVSGGALHVFTKDSVSDIEFLHNYFNKFQIECLKIVPSHWKALNMDDQLLLPAKFLIFGGEALQEKVVNSIRSSGTQCRVINHYGPTETTIGKLLHIVEPDAEYELTVPIGKPFSNTKVLVLNNNLKLCPIGVFGQLYISGDGVARGYLNNEALTKEKFIQNPFSKNVHSLMYSTGDQVKYLEDGNIEFIGRVDNQVKIRGYRIELGEIESILQQSEQVSQGVVLAREDKQGNKKLVGYVVAKGDFDREAIHSYLKEKLPEYMVPSVIVELESLPLTANGKVDRKSLPDPEATETQSGGYAAPRSATEEKLAEIWQEILEVEQVGIHDDFFELGGHSLLAIRLISMIRKKLGSEVKIGDVFDYPTIALLSGQLKGKEEVPLLPTIEVKTRPEKIPLSFSQERLWFIDQLEGSIQYHVPVILNLKGKLNIKALDYALQNIVIRHEVLRSVLNTREGYPCQHIRDSSDWQLSIIDDSKYISDKSLLQEYIKQLMAKPFDLSKDYMFRATLIILDQDNYILVAIQHHIASDGWSKSILVREVVELYESFDEKRSHNLNPLKIQYADYAIWQKTNLSGEIFNKKLRYWKDKLENVSALQLPTDYNRPAAWSSNGASLPSKIEIGLTTQLLELSQQNGVTLFMTLLSAFKILLHRYTGQNDICVGTPIAGRQQAEVEDLIGFFVNTLALRTDVISNATFMELLQQIKLTTLEAYENQEIPFEKVVDAVALERDISRNPIFQAMFVLRNTPDVPELKLKHVTLSAQNTIHTTAKFDIQIFLTETSDGLSISTEYCTDLFSEATIIRMIAHFKQLLISIANNPNEKISSLPMITLDETQYLLDRLNNTRKEYASGLNVIDLFEQQVLKTPDAISIIVDKQSYTYGELNILANQLASYLREIDVKDEMLVPICLERSIQMIVSIWGILKAGAAYVPIDPEYPAERISYMLSDINSKMVITNSESRNKIFFVENIDIIELDDTFSIIKTQPIENPGLHITLNQLAYVIYTSGSTGKPKGAMNEHGGLANRLMWAQDYFNLSHDDVVLQKTTFCFDVSVWELLWPSLIGAKLVFAKPGGQKDNTYLKSIIQRYNITVLHFVPSMLAVFLPDLLEADCSSLRKVLCSGEALKLSQVNLFKDKLPAAQLFNLYGPTEAAIDVTCWLVDNNYQNNGIVPIGTPVSNTSIYILDENQNLTPFGGIGEIYIGGIQVGRGYLNRVELTNEKFINDIFEKGNSSKLYKTGDLGRWLPDGNIQYVGRKDHQVKVRGYRIELGEIEAALQQSKLTEEVVVLAKSDKEGDIRLMSYYVPRWEVVKSREKELYLDRVANWKDLYNTEYAKPEDSNLDEEFNLIGWNNSFNGEPIPAMEMKEWVDDVVNIILSEKTGNVLEIGCGTGLIYYPLAGKVNKYTGTDLSRISIGQITEKIKNGERDYGPTELKICAAHEVILPEGEEVNTIILNSIIQYFPGEDYMISVIEKSLNLLNGNGRIIIGDIRDNRLLELFKYRLQLQKLQSSVSAKDLAWAVEQEVLKEEELCFSPDFFYQLKMAYPQISHIDIQWKNASYINELSLYRFTVIIYVGIQKQLTEPVWENWPEPNGKELLINRFKKGEEVIALKNAPNPRLWKECLLEAALKNESIQTVGEILNALEVKINNNIETSEVLNIAKENGYSYRLLLNEDPLKVNLFFEQSPSANFVKNAFNANDRTEGALYTNIPLFTNISASLQKEIKSRLKLNLPEYMIPSELIALTRMPITSNGKLDRKFLSEREDKAILNKLNYKAPATDLQNVLVNVWQELLNIEPIGIYDNFFELGGHSLLAIRLLAAIRKKLNIELSVNDIFVNPTINLLANCISNKESGPILSSIQVKARPQYIPLSFSQERLWFIDRFEGSIQYHIPVVVRLKGELDVEALAKSLQTIVNRHEALRTVFLENEGKPYQYIKEKNLWKLNETINSSFAGNQEELYELIKQRIKEPFDLSNDHMLRADLFLLGSQDYLLLVTMHHIASDGWSIGVMIKELTTLYKGYTNGYTPSIKELPIQYADYAIWQRDHLKDEIIENKINYWKNKLAGVAPLELPLDYPRPALQTTNGAISRFTINKELTEQVQKFSQQQGATLFMSLLAVLKTMLFRYTGQQDICVGTPVANRPQLELEDLVGFFINTLSLRSTVSGDDSFISLLQQVKITTLAAYTHQDVPFEKVVDAIVKERDLTRSPLFQVMLVLQNTPDVPELQLGDLQLSGEHFSSGTAKFELTFFITETESGLSGSVQYNTDLYKEETIKRMVSHFKNLLYSVVKSPAKKIYELPMLLVVERKQLLYEFNNTGEYDLGDKNVVELFEEQVKKSPGNLAIVFENNEVSYEELNARANQLANYLIAKGVGSDYLIPICIERGVEMIIAILAILKAGAAYVPIEPDYPFDRISYMLEDTRASFIVTNKSNSMKLFSSRNIEVIEIDSQNQTINNYHSENPQTNIRRENLAYIIYTSGSTGKPKGVMIEHASLSNYLLNSKTNYISKDKNSAGSFIHLSYTFDASITGIFMPLLAGKSIVIASNQSLNVFEDPNLQKYAPFDFIKITPSHLELLRATYLNFNNWVTCKLIIGGEALLFNQFNYFIGKGLNVEILNEYGPTETTVGCSTYSFYTLTDNMKFKNNVPVGKPIDNTQLYIFDENQDLVPIGAAGEIYIGGAGLARGYLNQNELTAERFIKNRFNKDINSRLYKTGDIGRWLSNGDIEYLGRIDDQVKIRGYRIELGEIESVILQSGMIKQNVVLALPNNDGVKRLVAYIIPEQEFDKEKLTSYLYNKLPEYMVPGVWMQLAEMPLTNNGKIDKKALPPPDFSPLFNKEYEGPRNAIEEALISIWQELLGIKEIGIHDNFFELGGDSILTIQVVSRARRAGYILQPRDIFLHQSVGKLSSAISNQSLNLVKGEQGFLTGEAGLLPIQQSYLQRNPAEISHFNQKVLLKIDKSLTVEKLDKALQTLVQHHDALRFVYTKTESGCSQEYGDKIINVVLENIQSGSNGQLSYLVNELSDRYQRSLNIEKGELMRVVFMQTGETEAHNRLLIVIHHLVVDGVSWRILLEDLEELLKEIAEGKENILGAKSSSYRQWYNALEEYSRGETLLSQRKYWQKAVKSYLPLPVDKNYEGVIRVKDTVTHSERLGAEQTKQLLQEVPRVYHTEINDILLSALAKTLCDWSGTEKIIVGMEGHGREEIAEDIDLSRTIGWFTSIYPVLLEIKDTESKDIDGLVKSVKEQIRQIPDRGLGYGVLKYINKEEILQINDPWEIEFNYLGQVDNVVKESKWFSGAGESAGAGRSEELIVIEKLSINSIIRGGELLLNWTYSPKQYKESTIQKLASAFIANLKMLISHCMDQQKTGVVYTPSDYGLGDEISYEELDQFLNERI